MLKSWLERADPDDVAALLVVMDAEKATLVAAGIARRVGPALAAEIEAGIDRAGQDPARTIANVGLGILQGLRRNR
jgi:hypothetical protein